MKDAPETPGDFDMILQNAEGIKNKSISNPEVEQNNAILEELETFADAINTNSTPTVTFGTSHRSITGYQIIDCFKNRTLLGI
jgi:hypothetical protein